MKPLHRNTIFPVVRLISLMIFHPATCANMKPSVTRSKSLPSNSVAFLDSVLADLERFQMSSSSRSLDDRSDEAVDETKKLAETWNSLGLIRLHMQKDAPSAKDCHVEALQIFERNRQRMDMAITLIDLGYCYERLNQQEDALRQYQHALTVLEEERVSKDHPRMMAVQRAISRITRS